MHLNQRSTGLRRATLHRPACKRIVACLVTVVHSGGSNNLFVRLTRLWLFALLALLFAILALLLPLLFRSLYIDI